MSEWAPQAGQLVEYSGDWFLLCENGKSMADMPWFTAYNDRQSVELGSEPSAAFKLLLPACTLDTAWGALKSVFGEGRDYCTQTSNAYINKRIFLAGDEAQYCFERDRFTPAIRFRLNLRVYLAGTDPTAADMFARTHLDRAAAIREWLRGVTQRSTE